MIKVDLAQLEAALQRDIEACEQMARPVAQAGAQVFYDAVRQNVARRRKRTGNLLSSIYQVYSLDKSAESRATYHVSWNARKAPHGHLVEFGYLQRYRVSFDAASGRFITHKEQPLPEPRHIAAKPFIRPAQARGPEALDAMVKKYLELLKAAGVAS